MSEPKETLPNAAADGELKKENQKLRGLLYETLGTLVQYGQDMSLVADIRKALEKHCATLDANRESPPKVLADEREIIEILIKALRYNRNEMEYRRYQIEGGHDILMTGEMHKAIEMATDALECAKRLTFLPETENQEAENERD